MCVGLVRWGSGPASFLWLVAVCLMVCLFFVVVGALLGCWLVGLCSVIVWLDVMDSSVCLFRGGWLGHLLCVACDGLCGVCG